MARRRPAPDQDHRDVVTRDLDTTLLVEAAAGTGKTTSLVDRMVALVASGRCRVETLAAVTFTRKATAEIRTRFQLALERAAATAGDGERERLLAGLRGVDRCFVGTIHAFCGRLLRERPIEAGVDPSFGELDDETDEELRRRAWREHVAALVAADAPVLPELERLGLKLSPAVRRNNSIVDELEQLGLEPAELGPAFLDCAKYPDVTRWPATRVDLPDLAHVVREVREYADHVRSLGLDGIDYGSDELMPHLAAFERMVRVRDLDEPAELMGVLGECRSRKVTQKQWPGRKAQALEEKARWDAFVDRHTPLVTLWYEHRYEPITRAMLPARGHYDRLRAAANGLNFQDLLLKSRDLLRDHPAVRRYFQRRFTHVLVDEFQDTDPIQAEVLFLLTADDPAETNWTRCRPRAGSLFVVGDPKQSIYRFRRADIVTYGRARDLILAAGGRVVPLTANFRSQRGILDWVNGCFSSLFPAVATDCDPANEPLLLGRGDVRGAPAAEVQRLTVPALLRAQVAVADYDADRIARTIRRVVDDRTPIARTTDQLARSWPPHAVPGDFLIVTWRRGRLSIYVRALERLGLPVDVTGGSLLNEVPELALLHLYLRALARPDDSIALVAVLRSELFGVADTTLYALRRAGGRFRFGSQLPEALPDEPRRELAEAFARLSGHTDLLRREPPAVAVERITAELGLLARAAASEEGAATAGGLLKAIELLRGESTLSEEAVDAVGRLVARETVHDGVLVLPPAERPVRVMNLHQCKGLEAPVVFLADPSGDYEHPIELFVDRSGEEPVGYIAIHGRRRSQYQPAPLLAHPPGWEDFEAEERRFREAEVKRLLYVAATRAGSRLVISRRGDENRNLAVNPWSPFEPFLAGVPELEDPGPVVPAAYEPFECSPADWTRDVEAIDVAWSRTLAPTYAVRRAKELSVAKGGVKPRSAERDGAEWGTLLHTLLEAAMRTPGSDLRGLALSTVEMLELDVDLVEEALATVEAVIASDLWARARSSERCLVEVPYTRLLPTAEAPGGLPTLVRGVVDLAFREPAGWVLVDYKSERVGEEELPALVDHYRGQLEEYGRAWEAIAGEPVRERGVLFTHTREYRRT